jgi:hypothetical protein
VKDYQGRPFVVLGVNLDADRDQFRRAYAASGQTWPSVWDGEGNIANAYGVDATPTVFLIDGRGVKRKAYGEEVPDKAELRRDIDELLAK